MPKINILDKSVFNLISAGEVVERPASVIKELVENSIDANSSSISIEIENGGKKLIRVIDNGFGIEKDDLINAFLPHATSKIKNADDLNKIGTLGFRGEALSSISAVSKVTVISKTKEEENGYKLQIIDNETSEIEPIGCTDGTSMSICDLFYNIPARAKFLKKDKLEESEITNIVSRLILANPNISFKYVADGKLIYQTFGTSLFDAIFAIYGKSVDENLIEINYKNNKYHIYGYIGKPIYSKPNRTYQTLIINGRYVINQSISVAILKGYDNFLMKSQFPFYVLNFNMDNSELDVNVHPNKLDVKFENSNTIFGLFLNLIAESLNDNCSNSNIKNINENEIKYKSAYNIDKSKLNTLNDFECKNYTDTTNKIDVNSNLIEVEINCNTDSNSLNKIDNVDNIIVKNNNNLSLSDNIINDSDKNNNTKSIIISKNEAKNLNSISSFLGKNNYFEDDSSLSKSLAISKSLNDKLIQQNIFNENNNLHANENLNYKIIGVAFNTYIIVEKNNELFFIDQHAGHERILFDKFFEEYKNNKNVVSQNLLIPYILEVNSIENEFLKDNLSTISNIGFDISIFGNNSFKIDSVPMLLKDINLKSFFNEVLSNINNKLIINSSDMMHDYIAKCACKNAIKANDLLDNSQIELLFNKLINENHTLLCPHGRPIITKITKNELEKWFKRIV